MTEGDCPKQSSAPRLKHLKSEPTEAAMLKSDPELLPIQRPRCPKCQTRMVSTAVTTPEVGFEDRTFECMKCRHAETRRMVVDPLTSPDAIAWTEGSLTPPR